jgi:succinate dehydrogenase/fumarate reductase flavoprotein subunit
MIPTVDTDVLVIGGGGAGARAALSAAESGARVMLALKGAFGTSGATAYRVASVAGFQAATGAADHDDTPDEHFRDIVRAAQGMCSAELARIVATEAPGVLDDLVKRGVDLDTEDGRPVISTGCFASRPRMYWIRGHGHSIVGVLKPAIVARGVDVRERVMVTSLLLADGACAGATLVDRDGRLVVVGARATVLCTGGAARLFAPSIVPSEITGDGYALAYRAGAALANLEFIQYGFGVVHPVTYLLSGSLWHLVPEMRNASGESVLPRYLPPGVTPEVCANARATHYPFSSRRPDRFADVAAHTEVLEGRGTERGGVLLDFTDTGAVRSRLPATVARRWDYLRDTLGEHGVDPARTPVEVSMFGHAFNGGVLIDRSGRSTLEGLYAAGEAAAGPHGADRLGGNMLMTSQVFGDRAGRAAASAASAASPRDIDHAIVHAEEARLAGMRRPDGSHALGDLLARLQRRMWRVAIVRTERSLRACLDDIADVENALGTARVDGPDDVRRAVELENLLLVGRLVTTAALARCESRGSHYRADFPETDDAAWGRSILVRCVGGRPVQTLQAL